MELIYFANFGKFSYKKDHITGLEVIVLYLNFTCLLINRIPSCPAGPKSSTFTKYRGHEEHKKSRRVNV